MIKDHKVFLAFIQNAIQEDAGDGDHSSLACIPSEAVGTAQLIIKEKGILAGCEIAKHIFHTLDQNSEFHAFMNDGVEIYPDDIVFKIKCNIHALLKAERITLNIMQRMSGIATQTREYAKKLHDLNTKILDTRKTTPGFRFLEKAAVKIGGGENHRMGLFDMIMLKDNHIDFSGGIENAIQKTNQYLKENKLNLKIVIEARTLEDVMEILRVGNINRVLLDNFSIKQTREAVLLINGKIETESSGGITLETIRDYAECGVDYISVGALTHQINSLDMSLKAIDY